MTLWVMFQKISSKMHPVSCTNTLHDLKNLTNSGIVQNTKTWISSEGNINFLWNEKIHDLCLRLVILRFFYFVAFGLSDVEAGFAIIFSLKLCVRCFIVIEKLNVLASSVYFY